MMRPSHRHRRAGAAWLALLLLAVGRQSHAAAVPSAVEAGLRAAGTNRAELERVIQHYEKLGDPQKLEAACFLIANMEGHGYSVFRLYNEKKEEVPFEALSYHNLGEAQAALDALEKKHGKLDFDRKQFVADLEVIRADYLIQNIDQSFAAWRTKPWARQVSFETFLDYILPHRGNKEPIEPWREACLQRYAGLESKLKRRDDLQEAAGRVMGDVGSWVGFSDLYYLHPTDQGFSELNQARRGRCGDIATLTSYAMHANAIPSAMDYTPFWADRDNNHAWTVILDAKGEGHASLAHRAAKIYRRTYSHQKSNLSFQLEPGEKAPRWLDRKSYKDVTAQYMKTTDVTVTLPSPAPPGARFAFLCVFNEGEWRPIHWGRISDRRVTFSAMGRNICYLPAYYVGDKILPAAPPLIVDPDGNVRTLAGGPGEAAPVQLTATAPKLTSPDTHEETPVANLGTGKSYELSVWQDGWKSLTRIHATKTAHRLDQARAGRLYWMVEDGSHKLERIFTVENGRQVWW